MLGNFFQYLALIVATLSVIFYVFALRDKSEQYLKIANSVFLVLTSIVAMSSVFLLIALTGSDFSLEYVFRYTDIALPTLYKLSAFWAGQAGSLLLWLLLIVVFGSVEIFRLKKEPLEYRAAVYLICAITAAFFAFLTATNQNPFIGVDRVYRDGMGMNPMLQNPGMIIHPPTLYVGYVGFTIVFAHAFAALITKRFSTDWIKLSRPWSLIIWIFLTVGIVIGGWWAYVELGWGGYWAWDPVENASLFPWFTATAFIHSAYIYERKNQLKIWSLVLALITFELTILGTFITRSGVIESVHSFGKNSIGNYFLAFIILTTATFLFFLYDRMKQLEDKTEFNYLSREGVFFIANWVFVGITFVTVFGTFLPWFSELFTGRKLAVGVEYFNSVSIPFFIAILIGSGVAPLIPFGKSSPDKFIKFLVPSAALAIVSMVVFYMMGYTLLIPLFLFGFATFSLFTILLRVGEMLKKGGLKSLSTANRFYGAMIVHLGVVLMALGITLSSFYNTHIDELVRQDSYLSLGKYEFNVGKVHTEKAENFISHYVPIAVTKGGEYVVTTYPELRLYSKKEDHSYAEVAYHSMVKGDLYFILSGFDLEKDQVRVQIYFQPLIGWIWFGCILMVIGGFYAVLNFRKNEVSSSKKNASGK